MRIRSSLAFAAAVALASILTAGPLAAQPTDRPWVFVSDSPTEPADRDPAAQIRNILLRPNVEGTFYVYVRNPTERDQEVTVLLSAEPADGSEFARVTVPVGAKRTVRVRPPRPAAEAVVPGGAKPVLPPATAVPKSLYLTLAIGRDLLERVELPVRVQVPSQYVVASPAFVTDAEGLGKLTVTLTDRRQDGKPFAGPPAKVHLDVSPARVPDLVSDSMPGSTFRGELRPGGRAVLAVTNVRFRGPNRAGVVAVDVDGYDRAFLFETDFSGTTPQPQRATSLHIAAPAYVIPGKPCPVRLEVDKPPAGAVVEFGIDRSNTGTFETTTHASDRYEAVGARWDGAAGGIVFVNALHDWVEDLETAGMTGTRRLRLRLLDGAGKVLVESTTNRDLVVEETISFDDTPPVDGRFGPFGKAVRNRVLDIAATASDPESGVARALFFLGEPPTADGKPAPGGRVVVATPPAREGGRFTAQLQMPDRAGPLAVGVRFINAVGLATDVIAEVVVAEAPNTGDIKVKVVQGSEDRPQPNVTVQILDEKKAAVVKTADADAKGEVTFKDMPPGKYVAFSNKPKDYAKAEKPVTVEVGKVAEVTLSLKR
jgi:Prealbumin-like fold domain